MRHVFRHERVPVPMLWLLAADGTVSWYRWLARGLADGFGGRDAASAAIARISAIAFERRYTVLRARWPHLPDPDADRRAVALTMAGLYRAPSFRKATWILDGVGGPPRGPVEAVGAWRSVRPLSMRRTRKMSREPRGPGMGTHTTVGFRAVPRRGR